MAHVGRIYLIIEDNGIGRGLERSIFTTTHGLRRASEVYLGVRGEIDWENRLR